MTWPKAVADKRVHWKIRPMKHDDAPQLDALTRLIYGNMWKRAGDATYYRWKFYSEGLPQPNAQVAAIGNDIVGFQSSCHRHFRFGPKTVYSTELGDSMTHPDYRRQGMWGTITHQVIDDALDRGFIPVNGFPNNYSYPGYIRKLSMDHFFNVTRLALVLQPNKLIAKIGVPLVLQDTLCCLIDIFRKVWIRFICLSDPSIRVERICKVGAWADRLWEYEVDRMEAGVVKDAEYLRWRFEKNPDDYVIYLARDPESRPLGFLITKTRKKKGKEVFGFIADMLVPSRKRKVLHRLLFEAEKDFKKAGVVLVDAWTTPIVFYLFSLISYGFLPVARLPFIIPASQADFLRRKGWGSSKRWFLTMGDSDNI